MKKLIIILAIALISCEEKKKVNYLSDRLDFITDSLIQSLNDGCASGRYECVSSMTASPIWTISCKGCATETVTCESCGNSTISPNK